MQALDAVDVDAQAVALLQDIGLGLGPTLAVHLAVQALDAVDVDAQAVALLQDIGLGLGPKVLTGYRSPAASMHCRVQQLRMWLHSSHERKDRQAWWAAPACSTPPVGGSGSRT